MQKTYSLSTYNLDLIRGDVLICQFDKLDPVRLMVIDLPLGNGLEYALLIINGYKAGMVFSRLPMESIPADGGGAVGVQWMRDQWGRWGYFECPIEYVFVIPNADADL